MTLKGASNENYYKVRFTVLQIEPIGGICAFKIGSLHQLGNKDRVVCNFVYAPQGVDLGEGGSSERNDKGLSQGMKCGCKAVPLLRCKICGKAQYKFKILT